MYVCMYIHIYICLYVLCVRVSVSVCVFVVFGLSYDEDMDLLSLGQQATKLRLEKGPLRRRGLHVCTNSFANHFTQCNGRVCLCTRHVCLPVVPSGHSLPPSSSNLGCLRHLHHASWPPLRRR